MSALAWILVIAFISTLIMIDSDAPLGATVYFIVAAGGSALGWWIGGL